MRHGTKRLFAAVFLTIEQSTPGTSLSFCSLSFFCPFFSRRSVTIILTHRSRYLRWNHFPPLLVNANCSGSNELATQIYLEFHILYLRAGENVWISGYFPDKLDLSVLNQFSLLEYYNEIVCCAETLNSPHEIVSAFDTLLSKLLFWSLSRASPETTSRYQDYRLVQSTNLTKFSTHGIELRHQLSNLCRTWLLTAQVGLIWSGVTHSLTRLTSFINVMLLGGSGHF